MTIKRPSKKFDVEVDEIGTYIIYYKPGWKLINSHITVAYSEEQANKFGNAATECYCESCLIELRKQSKRISGIMKGLEEFSR